MAFIDESNNIGYLRSLGGDAILVCISGTTDSAGTASLDNADANGATYDGSVTIATAVDSLAAPTGVYTITLPKWATTLMAPQVSGDQMDAVGVSAAASPTAGTIVLTYDAALVSGDFTVTMLVSAGGV